MLSIKHVEKSDFEKIISIERACYHKPWSLEFMNRELYENPSAIYYKLLKKKSIVGFAGFWALKERAHITNIAIELSSQGNGYGEYLLNYLIDQCKINKYKVISLEVRVSNKKAIKLYKKVGFVLYKIIPEYYGEEDAFLLVKYL